MIEKSSFAFYRRLIQENTQKSCIEFKEIINKNVNNIDESVLQELLSEALANKNEEVSAFLLECKDFSLEYYCDGFTPLHIASMEGLHQFIALLIEKGCPVDTPVCQSASQVALRGRTALHFAAGNNHLQSVICLLSFNANPNALDAKLSTPLALAVGESHLAILPPLLQNGANPLFSHKNGIDTILELANDQENSRALITALLKKFSPLDKYYNQFMEEDLTKLALLIFLMHDRPSMYRAFVLSAIRNQRYKAAHAFLTHPNRPQATSIEFISELNDQYLDGLAQLTPAKLQAGLYREHLSYLRDQAVFAEEIDNAQQAALLDAFAQIATLLAMPRQCLGLLKEVDLRIKTLQHYLNVDFSSFHPGEGLIYHGLKWPSPPTNNEYSFATHGLMRYILRLILARNNLDTQDTLFNFYGFVDSEVANEIVKQGSLFKENALFGNSLLHGTLSHYFHLVIVSLAIEQGVIQLQANLTIRDILKALVEVTINEKVIWGYLIDAVDYNAYNKRCQPDDVIRIAGNPVWSGNYIRHTFSAVKRLNSTLLQEDSLPHVRGLLLKMFYKDVQKIQHYVQEKQGKSISYEAIVGGQALAHFAFNRFTIHASIDDVEQSKDSKKITWDKANAISTKKSIDSKASFFSRRNNTLEVNVSSSYSVLTNCTFY